MDKEPEEKQHSLHTRTIIKWLLLVTIVGIILSTCVIDWPYYKASVPGGYTTESRMFMRGTWGEQAHLPLVHGAKLTVRTICYPRESSGFQSCNLVITLVNPSSNKINFTEGEFIVRDPSNHEIRFDTRTSRKENGVTLLLFVHLSYKKPPREFELLLPDIAINSNVQEIPAIKFQYEDSFPYQFDLWLSNY